jgi:bile acid-coenzyme A ligase
LTNKGLARSLKKPVSDRSASGLPLLEAGVSLLNDEYAIRERIEVTEPTMQMSHIRPTSDLAPTFSEQFAKLARDLGEVTAVVHPQGQLSFRELDENTNRAAGLFASLGVGVGDFVVVSTADCSLMIQASVAAWKVGAVPTPVSDRLTQPEFDAIVDLAGPALVVDDTDRPTSRQRIRDLSGSRDFSVWPMDPVIGPHLKAPTSGGSTGRPKIIVSGASAEPQGIVAHGDVMRVPSRGVCLVTAALYHNASFGSSLAALVQGSTVVLMDRFDPEQTLRLIEMHSATWVYVVPTMMQRIWKLLAAVRESYDVSSLQTLLHLAAPCPQWLKREWINWLGPEVVHEIFGATEGQAGTAITGEEWLSHPGSVGRVSFGQIVIRGPGGKDLPVGERGEIWMRRGAGEAPGYQYLGATAELGDDGWETVGDMGWFDEDGYLFLADRRSDMLLVGGINVYPAEIESAASEHPQVLSACCVGLEDSELGTVPGLVVEVASGQLPKDLEEHLSARLARVKRPRRVKATAMPLRDPAGKTRRREVAENYFGTQI